MLKNINIDFKNVPYEFELFRDTEQLNVWKNAGHNIENTRIGINQSFDISQLESIKEHFSYLSNIGICFHVLTPGNYLPEHRDYYGFYANKYNITDLNQIERSVVFLENHKPGHFLTVENSVYANWSAGDICTWQGTKLHSAINLGIDNRYTLQVTGILC